MAGNKISQAQYKVLLGRVMDRNPQRMPEMEQPMGQMQQPMQPQAPMLPPEMMQPGQEMWQQMQPGIGGRLWERLHAQSPMSSGMYGSPEEAFVGTMGGMMAGQGKQDPDLAGFISDMLKGEGKQIVPGYGVADEADMEVLNAFNGGVNA